MCILADNSLFDICIDAVQVAETIPIDEYRDTSTECCTH